MLSAVLDELVEKRDLDRAVLKGIIEAGIVAAYEKKYPGVALKIECDAATGEISVFIQKTVVSSVKDDEAEISLKKARNLSKKAKLGDELWVPFDGFVGRIEILRARQVIANMIRKVEADAVFNEFKEKEGDVVHGTIHKCGRSGMVVKVEDTLAFLPQQFSIPGDKCVVGFAVRALLKEVLSEPRNDNQLILDRASDLFLRRLFELEIPEIFERLVEIRNVVRTAGYKSKVVVVSNDKNIDAVGTCIGIGGGRIKPILKELGGEKIDVIAWTDSQEKFVRDALKPAQVNRVEIANGVATIWVDDDQRSLAIGKMGQNISLASRLTGLDIRLAEQAPTSVVSPLSEESLEAPFVEEVIEEVEQPEQPSSDVEPE